MCDECQADIEPITSPCLGCGLPKDKCICSKNKFNLNLAAAYLYTGNIKKAIHRFKFHSEKELASFFGQKVAKAVKTNLGDKSFDLVTCVPLTKHKQHERGYNQAALLAKEVAKQLGIAYCETLLIKKRDTKDQHSLKAKERIENIKNAFAVPESERVKGKTVLICDDIKTTGATLNECRKTLLRAGAKEVCCAAIAAVPEKVNTEP